MWVGCLIKINAPFDVTFDGQKGMIVKRVESDDYTEGYYFQVQLFDGHIVIALPHEIEILKNEVET